MRQRKRVAVSTTFSSRSDAVEDIIIKTITSVLHEDTELFDIENAARKTLYHIGHGWYGQRPGADVKKILESCRIEEGSEKGTLVLSDLDGTIVRGSTVLNHAVMLEQKGVINTNGLVDAWIKDQKNENLIARLAESYREQIKGKTEKDIYSDEFIEKLMSNPTNFYSSLHQIKTLRRSGAKVVIVSGSPGFLVSRIAERLGVDHVASIYSTDSNGLFTGQVEGMFSADSKRCYVKTLPRFKSVYAFGDTSSDIPLMEAADDGKRFLVDPHDDTLRSYKGISVIKIPR